MSTSTDLRNVQTFALVSMLAQLTNKPGFSYTSAEKALLQQIRAELKRRSKA